jgi:drug/metabolite transporter (DMT)-like permease
MFLVRFALLSSLFYALNVSMIPLIYSFEVSVFLFLFIRFGTTFCSSLFVTKSLFSFKKIKQQRLGLWIFLLSLLFAVQSWLYVEAVKYMSVGLASVVLFTYPLLTYLIVSITKKRSLDLTTILMFLIAIAGIAAISQSDEGFYTMAIGIILALLSALSYSLILIITPKMGSLRNWEIVKFTTLIPALSFLILFLSETGFYWPQKEALLLCFISGTLFAIGMMFYHISVKKYGPVRTANIGYTEPLLVLIFGFIAYLDTITIIQGIGVIMVALASITIEKRQLIQNNTAGE